jgi:hypothetical protein
MILLRADLAPTPAAILPVTRKLVSIRVMLLARGETRASSSYGAICSVCSILRGHLADLPPSLLQRKRLRWIHTSIPSATSFRGPNVCACRTIERAAAGVRCPRLACCSSSRALSGWLGSYLDDILGESAVYTQPTSLPTFSFSRPHTRYCRIAVCT